MILFEPAPDGPQRSPVQRRGLAAFLKEARTAVGLDGRVTVLLTSDAAVCELNRRFRRKNKPTDVLSFPAAGHPGPGRSRAAGDLAISLDTASRQASAYGHSLDTEVRVLILHGLLHLAGMDHERDTGEMAAWERVLRRRLHLPAAGLIERAAEGVAGAGRETATRISASGIAPRLSPGRKTAAKPSKPAARGKAK